MAVHILGGGVGDDVSPPLEGAAVDGGGKGVVHNEGDPVAVGSLGELFNVQHREGRVGNGLAKHGLGVRPEGSLQLLGGAVRVHEGELNSHLPHGHMEKVKGPPVNSAAGHYMVAAIGNIEDGVEVGCLAAAGQHGGSASLQLADLGCHIVVGRVLEPGVEIAAGLQVKELSHILAGSILEGSALDNGDLPGLPVPRGIAPLYTDGITIKTHIGSSFP